MVDLRQERERARDSGGRPGWLTTRAVDLDGWENQEFWRDYWDNGLVGTALYYTLHLATMPERAGAALSAIVSAETGGVLFHCMGGRDRTGLIAMLLLSAIDTEPDEIVRDYLETVRRGEIRAAHAGRTNDEPALETFCQSQGTTTEKAFRDARSRRAARPVGAQQGRTGHAALLARHRGPTVLSGASERTRILVGWPFPLSRSCPTDSSALTPSPL